MRFLHATLTLLMAFTLHAIPAPAGTPKAPPPRARADIEAILAKAPKRQAKKTLRPLHVVLLADVKDHGPQAHDYPRWQKRWALLLGGKTAPANARQVNLYGPPIGELAAVGAGAAKVKVTTAWKWPSDEQFRKADLIVMFCYRSGGPTRTWSDRQVKQLETYFARGCGFVAIHPATYTLRKLSESPRVAALTGMGYDRTIRWRHGRLTLTIARTDHHVCLGLPKTFDLYDEPYWPPVGDLSKVTVLATSNEPLKKGSDKRTPQPLFWTARHGKGRIFVCVPGHFTWTFDDPLVRILLLRGMAWAAGESPFRFDPLILRGARVK